jgi:thiol-disulfide isomerase/thioredoxin
MSEEPRTRRPGSAILDGVLVLAVALVIGGGWLAFGGGRQPAKLPLVAAMLATPMVPDPNRAVTRGRDWLNTPPLSAEDLRGKVVLVNFWTYSCINSLRPLPYVRAWAAKYRDRGLVVIGVHTPEFGFEKDLANVRHALADQGIAYPVVLDSDFKIWNAFANNAWPAFYFIGADGRVRQRKLGEGDYEQTERLIQALLSERQHAAVADPIVAVAGTGAQAAPDWNDIASEETYVGHAKAEGFASEGGIRPDVRAHYHAPARLALNRWSLAGGWTVGEEFATLAEAPGTIAYRFHARDLNLVMGPAPDRRPIRFRLRIDGAEPGASHGADVDSHGAGTIGEPRMYQLVRQATAVSDRQVEIEFLDPGARLYVFTFG